MSTKWPKRYFSKNTRITSANDEPGDVALTRRLLRVGSSDAVIEALMPGRFSSDELAQLRNAVGSIESPPIERGWSGAFAAPSQDIGPRHDRRRRFRRDPDFRSERSRAGRLELRDRDLDIIAAIARHRFMNSDQICRAFGCSCPRRFKEGRRTRPAPVIEHAENCSCTCGLGSRKGVHAASCIALFRDDQHLTSRLRELFQQGYLNRPLSQLQLGLKGSGVSGSLPMVYSVTRKGLDVIGPERRERLGAGKLSWAARSDKGTSQVFMEHTLRIGSVSLAVDLGVRAQRGLSRVSETALLAGMSEERRNSAWPWKLRTVHRGRVLSTICDLAFAIEDSVRRRQFNFAFEVDLGHMAIARQGLDQTSLMRKLIGYARAHADKQHKTEFGWKAWRVVVLTTSEERVAHCVAEAERLLGSSDAARIFLFGTLEASDDLFGYEFTDVYGRQVRLLE